MILCEKCGVSEGDIIRCTFHDGGFTEGPAFDYDKSYCQVLYRRERVYNVSEGVFSVGGVARALCGCFRRGDVTITRVRPRQMELFERRKG